MTFANGALRWAWISAHILHWRPAEFWEATPAELAVALLEPEAVNNAAGPTRQQISQMMEREAHGR